MQLASFAQRHAGEPALGSVGRLADRLRHLTRLAVAETNPALLVADDDQSGKAEAAAALYHLGDAIDVDELVDEFAVAFFAASALARFTGHVAQPFCLDLCHPPLEIQSAFARRIGEHLDPAVVAITAAVEHHVLDALLLGALGDELAHRFGGID